MIKLGFALIAIGIGLPIILIFGAIAYAGLAVAFGALS